MTGLVLIRITKNTNEHDAIMREGDFVFGPSSTINLLLNHSNVWHNVTMDYKVSSVEELKRCRSGHVRYHFFERANFGGFDRRLVSKVSALDYIKSYGIANYEKPNYL